MLVVDGVEPPDGAAVEVAVVAVGGSREIGAGRGLDVALPNIAAEGVFACDKAEDVPEGGAILGVDKVVTGDGDAGFDEVPTVGQIEEFDEAGAVHLLAVAAQEVPGRLRGFDLVEREADAAFHVGKDSAGRWAGLQLSVGQSTGEVRVARMAALQAASG